MNERTPLPGYRLFSRPSTDLKLKYNHYQTPCTILVNNIWRERSAGNDFSGHYLIHSMLTVLTNT